MNNPINKSADILSRRNYKCLIVTFPGSSAGKESTCNAGDLERYPGEEKGYPLQYSGLEDSMERGAWQATDHGVSKSQI